MNKLIQQFAEQAGLQCNKDEAICFAESIVRECAEVAGCNGHVSGFALGDLIKQHFGVEK